METGSQILNYTGNAGLALGSSPDVTNVGVGDMTPLNQTARELALSSLEANKTLYAQKIADRDKVYKLIQDEAFNAPILEEHRPIVEAARKEMLDAFYKNPDIMNNPQAYRDFTDKYTTALQTAKQAQKRYASAVADQADLKTATNPYDQHRISDFAATNRKKPFWQLPDVYAPATHADMNVVAQPAAYGQEVKTRVGTDNVFTKNIDIPGTFENFQKAYLDPTKRDMFDKYIHGDSKYYGGLMNSEHAKPELDRLNGILVSRGIAPINEATDRTDQIAAKVAIANADPTLTRKEYAAKEVDDAYNQQQIKEKAREANMENALGYAKLAAEKSKLQFDKDKWKDTLSKTGASSSMVDESYKWAKDQLDQARAMGVPTARGDKGVVILPSQLGRLNPLLLDNLAGYTVDEKGHKVPDVNNPIYAHDGEGTVTGLNIDALVITPDGKIRAVPKDKLRKDARGAYTYTNAETKELPDVQGLALNYLKDKSQYLKPNELGATANIDTQGETGPQYNTKNSKTATATQSGSNATGNKSNSKTPIALSGEVDPASLQVGQTYNVGGVTRIWNGSKLVKAQ